MRETRGRKKKNFRSDRKCIYCGDLVAWRICQKKGINASLELTRALQRIAYSAENLKQAELLTIEKIHTLEDRRDRELEKLANKYEAEIRSTAQELSRIQQKITHKQVKDSGL